MGLREVWRDPGGLVGLEGLTGAWGGCLSVEGAVQRTKDSPVRVGRGQERVRKHSPSTGGNG